MLPGSITTVSSAAPSGTATYTERAAPKGTAACQQKGGDFKSSACVGADPDESELNASLPTQSASPARRRECCYVNGGLSPMPPPSEWKNSNGSSATLLKSATIDAHTLYRVFPLWKHEGIALDRTFPIPVVLRSDETVEEYVEEFLCRVKRMQMK